MIDPCAADAESALKSRTLPSAYPAMNSCPLDPGFDETLRTLDDVEEVNRVTSPPPSFCNDTLHTSPLSRPANTIDDEGDDSVLT